MASVKAKKKAKVRKLGVVFDTSVLWAKSEADLVRQEVETLIREHSQCPDLAVSWYLPNVVRHERQFQMQGRALDLLPAIQKLERLLGNRLNITASIIEERVNDVVEKQIVDLGLKTLELDQTQVEWSRLVLDACYRRPPFEAGEREMGFRDALIAEAFLQLVKASPKAARTCLIILVTGDNALADTVRTRTSDAANVRIVGSLEELKGLISTIAEAVAEEFVKIYQSKAKDYFFEEGQKECIYYKLGIRNRITDEFREVLESIPHGADERRNGKWYIGAPRFVKKLGQRTYWATRINVEAEAYKWAEVYKWYDKPAPAWLGTQPVTWLGTQPVTWPGHQPATWPGTKPATWPGHQPMPWGSTLESGSISLRGTEYSGLGRWEMELFSTGRSVFEVIWSVVITTRGKFTSLKIESLEHRGTNWE